MAAGVVLTVRCEPLGEPETGVWCERCALPSGVRLAFALYVGSRVPTGVCTVGRCVDCGSEIT